MPLLLDRRPRIVQYDQGVSVTNASVLYCSTAKINCFVSCTGLLPDADQDYCYLAKIDIIVASNKVFTGIVAEVFLHLLFGVGYYISQ